MTQRTIGAGLSGFIPNEGSPPRNLPAKIGLRRHARPELTFTIDGWFLSPSTLRLINQELRRKTADAADPERLCDVIASIERFLNQRRLYGEGSRVWP